MNRKEHWNQVYQTKGPLNVSWYQARPETSLQLIAATGIGLEDELIDVGGGASTLVDCLLTAGFQRVSVLDVSAAALVHARQRLGTRADLADWFEADVTTFVPPRPLALWHDRAVFHFLTDPADRRRYVETLSRALISNGHAIIATFSTKGPSKCSGLEVMQYDAHSISAELGRRFELVEQVSENHHTPLETEQQFSYFLFRKTEI